MTSAFSTLTNSTELQALTDSKSSPSLLIVLLFTASWHEPSVDLIPVLESLTKQYSPDKLRAFSMDADKFDTLATQYGVSSVPTVLFLRGSKEIDRFEGADSSELSKRLLIHEKQPSLWATHQIEPSDEKDVDARLKKLINAEPVMVFMKGSPDAPRCGFSHKLVQLLEDRGIKFGSFDILSDEMVRQELKRFSNWPTYPQIYANGELLGGLDIIMEMDQNGELMESVPDEAKL